MAFKRKIFGAVVCVPFIFVFGNGIGAYVVANELLFQPIAGVVLSHTNVLITDESIEKKFRKNLKQYVDVIYVCVVYVTISKNYCARDFYYQRIRPSDFEEDKNS